MCSSHCMADDLSSWQKKGVFVVFCAWVSKHFVPHIRSHMNDGGGVVVSWTEVRDAQHGFSHAFDGVRDVLGNFPRTSFLRVVSSWLVDSRDPLLLIWAIFRNPCSSVQQLCFASFLQWLKVPFLCRWGRWCPIFWLKLLMTKSWTIFQSWGWSCTVNTLFLGDLP